MNEFMESCHEQIKMLEKVIEECEKHLQGAPEGSLRVSKNKNNYQFYHRTDAGDTCGKYLRKSKHELVERLAQKGYTQKLLKLAKEKIAGMEQCTFEYDWKELEDLYEDMSPTRKALVVPYVMSEVEYARKWERQNQELLLQMKKKETERGVSRNVNKFELTEENGIMTEKGELVRSKSEKILADKLYMMGVPYVYELPLYLKGYGRISPDFTVLNMRTRKTYYWEHFGMMDNPEYSEKTIKKIELYEKNGVFLGKQLITTFESLGHSMNMKVLEEKIKVYLK